MSDAGDTGSDERVEFEIDLREVHERTGRLLDRLMEVQNTMAFAAPDGDSSFATNRCAEAAAYYVLYMAALERLRPLTEGCAELSDQVAKVAACFTTAPGTSPLAKPKARA